MGTINFRGKKISFSEARKYINGLKTGGISAELVEEEKNGYEIFKKINNDSNEKEYLIGTLEVRIAIKEHYNKIEKCKREGHPDERVLSTDSSGTALCMCRSCGDMYNRKMTLEETREFNKLIRTPFTR